MTDGLALCLELPYPPSANRIARAGKDGRVRVSKEVAKYKVVAGLLAKREGATIIDGDVSVMYELHPRSKKDGSVSRRRIDLGNCEKVVSDALNGIAWHDDKQIVGIMLLIGEPMVNGGLTVRIWSGGRKAFVKAIKEML